MQSGGHELRYFDARERGTRRDFVAFVHGDALEIAGYFGVQRGCNEDYMNASNWLLFIANLPGRNQTLRMRVWRSLKASGAGTLRDSVYVLPMSHTAREVFERQQQEIQSGGGTAYILELAGEVGSTQGNALRALFDRTRDYEAIAVTLQLSSSG